MVKTLDCIVNVIVASKINRYENKLLTFDNYIQILRSTCYTDLQAPLSAEEFEGLEQKYDITIPKDLKAHYRSKNGAK